MKGKSYKAIMKALSEHKKLKAKVTTRRRSSSSVRACHQAGVDENERVAEQLRAHRSRLDQVVDREAADDAHHDARDILRGHREARRSEVARSRLERGGERAAKVRLALGVASAELGV